MNIFDFSNASLYGIINSFQTDNIIINVLIAVLIPLLIPLFTSQLTLCQQLTLKLWEKYMHRSKLYRTISYEEIQNSNGHYYTDDKDNTHLLHKILTLYINENCDNSFDEGEYRFVEPNSRYYDSDSDSDSDSDPDEDGNSRNNSILKQIKKSKLVSQPDIENWVRLTPQIEYKRIISTENEEAKKNKNVKTVTNSLVFRSELYDIDYIEKFIQQAIVWYNSYISQRSKNSRYMYLLQRKIDDKNCDMFFKRYSLHLNKTFDTIFIPHKNQILSLIDDFESGKGKFAIPGFPKHLNILLTGPPGTGKTSLIKAISTYTNRHIIDIPISKISSNQSLYDMIFGKTFKRLHENYTDKHNFSRTIFVMEDIDCISAIVYKRKKEMDDTENAENNVENNEEKNNIDLIQQLINPVKNEFKYSRENDPLTLSGILNVIDGVIECPKRILIITTNHPEKLDPALTRPGRINIKLKLDYVETTEMMQMIENYIGIPSEKETGRITNLFSNDKFKVTPAYVEKLCIEYNTISEILEYLENNLDSANNINE